MQRAGKRGAAYTGDIIAGNAGVSVNFTHAKRGDAALDRQCLKGCSMDAKLCRRKTDA